MPRISSNRRIGSKAGFTLLEILIVITIMALAVSLMLPNVKRQLSQMAVQDTFFEFQRQVTGLRAQAYHENLAISLVSSGEYTGNADDYADAEVRPGEIVLNPEGTPDEQAWTYRMSDPMTISAGGVCDAADVDLIQYGKVAAHLESRPDCHFVRVYT